MKPSLGAPKRIEVWPHALAAGALAAAAALRWALGPTLGAEFPLILFLPPIVVAALAGGLRLGLLTTTVGCAIGVALFMPRSAGTWPIAAMDWMRIALFLVAGAFVSWVVTSSRLGWQRAYDTQRAADERLRSEHARTVRILESIGDAFYAVDADFRFTYVNSRAEQLWGKRREDLLGRRLWDEVPQGLGSESPEMHLKVMRELQPVQFETRSPTLGIWLDVSLYPDTNGGLACYFRDVSERKRAEEALRAADRRKDEFLAVLGHELRNPLAPLRSGVELLELARGRPELIEGIRVMMQRQVGHLVHLVDDLLDLSRITRGQIQLRKDTVDLHAVVAAAVELTQPFIVERGHELTVDPPGEAIRVFGDAERLTQIVGNLLSNAAKYTPAGGRIDVRAQVSEGRALVRVRDTGFGIPAERLDDIFDMFTQVPEHRAHIGGGGLGVGLALSRRLSELHGGTLEAASEGLDRGSEFTLRLPLAEMPAVLPAQSLQTAAAQILPQRVLVVDDNVDAADTLRLVLDLQGHQTEVAYDPPSALTAVERFAPHCVLLDIGLPGVDGYETARRIRSLPSGGRTRLIAVTGWGQQEDKQRAWAAGFDAHLTKPVDFAAVAALLADTAHSPTAGLTDARSE
jgi:PAS domain S-box-containing protein